MRRSLPRFGWAAALPLAALACARIASADPPPPAPPLPSGRPPAPPPAPLPSAMVRISPPDSRLALERRTGSLDFSPVPRSMYADPEPRWERVCVSPCQALLPIMGEYRIAGEGVTPSSTFSLRQPGLDLQVNAGSASARTAGAYTALFGFLIAAVGGTVLAISAVSSDKSAANHTSMIAGAVGLAAGGAVGLTGLCIVLGTRTTVNDVHGGSLPEYTGPLASLHATGRF